MKNAENRLQLKSWIPWTIFALIVLIGASSRFLLEEYPNFKPVGAMALFAGFYFRRLRVAAAAILLMMFLSDLFLGIYDVAIMASVYTSMLVAGGIGIWIGRRFERSPRFSFVASLIGSLTMSTLFFVLTNSATWWCWYQHSWSELMTCFSVALPFYRTTLTSDLLFTFGWSSLFHLFWIRSTATRKSHQPHESKIVETGEWLPSPNSSNH